MARTRHRKRPRVPVAAAQIPSIDRIISPGAAVRLRILAPPDAVLSHAEVHLRIRLHAIPSARDRDAALSTLTAIDLSFDNRAHALPRRDEDGDSDRIRNRGKNPAAAETHLPRNPGMSEPKRGGR
jgi:hypothetical protein